MLLTGKLFTFVLRKKDQNGIVKIDVYLPYKYQFQFHEFSVVPQWILKFGSEAYY